MDMTMMMCYDLMCASKPVRGQLSLAHSTKVKCRHARENQKTAEVRGVSLVGGKVEELWRKGCVEKMSFEPRMEERRSDGW